MSRVRIEIWDNEDNIRAAEVEHSDSRTAFDQACRMAEATLPDDEAPKLKAGSYTFEMKNVQMTDVTRQMLFLDAEGRKRAGFDVKIVSDAPPRKPCGESCQDDDGPCTDTCARPAGHDDWHVTSDGACTWGPEEGEGSAQLCLNEIGAPSKTRNCHQKLGHDGHCDGEQDALMDGLRPPLCTGTFEYKEEGKWLRRADCQRPLNHKGDCGRAVL